MKRKSLFGFLVATLAIFTQSCDGDFNEIGSDMFGNDGFGFETYEVQNIEANTVSVGQVSTRNLPINNLGVYNDPVFGKTVAHFVTQLEMASGTEFTSVSGNPIIDSVYVYIPYNSVVENTNSDGDTAYKLNNVYGNGTFVLNVFENGYLLRNYDPNNNLETQEYYSSDKPLFDANKKGGSGGRLNNSSITQQNKDFKFSDQEIVLYKYNSEGELIKDSDDKPLVKERKKPGIWLDLDKGYFQERFFANNKNQSLINNNIFKDYFRGLYFNVESIGGENALAQLDFSGGEFVIIYKSDKTNTDGTNSRQRNTIKLKMGNSANSKVYATTVNLIENDDSNKYKDALGSQNANSLWIKGNNGSIATISLFDADELERIKRNDWLLNQAVLTITVDKTEQINSVDLQPNRLFLYDAKNNKTLVDYDTDASTSPIKSVYNGLLDSSSDQNSVRYRFRITNHINNLIKKDSTNVLLGLAVTSDISLNAFNVIKNPINSFNTIVKKIPVGSVISPFGTVIYGPNHQDVNTKMKLELYYTKKNN